MESDEKIINLLGKYENIIEPTKVRNRLVFFSVLLTAMYGFDVEISSINWFGILVGKTSMSVISEATSVIITYYFVIYQIIFLKYIISRFKLLKKITLLE